MFDKFRIKVTILASLIITAYCFFTNTAFLKTGYILIFTIIIFYFLGGIAELELKSHIEKIALLKIDEFKEDENEETILENETENEMENETNDINLLEEDFYDNIEFEDEENEII